MQCKAMQCNAMRKRMSNHRCCTNPPDTTGITKSGGDHPGNAIGAWCPFLDVVCTEVIPHHKPTAVAQTCSEHVSHNTLLQSGAQPITHYLPVHLCNQHKDTQKVEEWHQMAFLDLRCNLLRCTCKPCLNCHEPRDIHNTHCAVDQRGQLALHFATASVRRVCDEGT